MDVNFNPLNCFFVGVKLKFINSTYLLSANWVRQSSEAGG